MGSGQQKCTVATLNYSGIYQSPFQYYAIDNWQELERIGIIFEEELKKDYQTILKKYTSYGGKNSTQSEYKRKSFEYDIGDIDKEIHEHRYSPIYTLPELKLQKKFAGIGQKTNSHGQIQQYLLNQDQFFTKWDEVFTHLEKRNDKRKIQQIATKAKPYHRYHCCSFDFMCYRAIIIYLHNRIREQDASLKQKNSATNFEEIVRNSQGWENQNNLISRYKQFMLDYFERIDTNNKLQLTISCLFGFRNSPEIISFTEATSKLKEHLEKQSNYYLFESQKKETKTQTILMVKKSLPFVPQGYSSLQRNDQNDSIKAWLKDQLKQYLHPYEQFWTNEIAKQKIKGNNKSQKKIIQNIEKLKENIMSWAQDIIFAKFINQQEKIILGAFHLSSKPEKNSLQVQLLGLIIYILTQNNYKFIFSGDFNSYVSTNKKEQALDLLAFTRFCSFSRQNVDSVEKSVRIYPKHPKIITTKKKRTILQAQFRKVNELAEKSIDQVITNYPIYYNQCHVGQIKDIGSDRNSNQSFLPHKEHPYDHFLVQAFLDISHKQP